MDLSQFIRSCSQDQLSVLRQTQPVFPSLVDDHQLLPAAEQGLARDARRKALSFASVLHQPQPFSPPLWADPHPRPAAERGLARDARRKALSFASVLPQTDLL